MPKVFIDAGHGGVDPGATNNGMQEKNINLEIALKVMKELDRLKVEYAFSRNVDRFVELDSICKISNAYKPDLFISIHCNDAGNIYATGYEIYHSYGGGAGKRFAQILSNHFLTAGLKPHGYPVKFRQLDDGRDYYCVIRETDDPAVIVETGFIKHDKIDTDLICKCITLAVIEYFKIITPVHWAETYYNELKNVGVDIQEKNFDNAITRGECLKLLYELHKTLS